MTLIDAGDLPSNKKIYDIQAYFRPYTYGELKIASQSVISIPMMIDTIAEGIHIENFDPLDLTLSDFLYIGLLRKLYTLGASASYSLSHDCICGNEIHHRIDPSSFVFTDLKHDFPSTFKYGDTRLMVKPITAKEYKQSPLIDEFEMLGKCCGLTKEQVFNTDNITDMEAIDKAVNHTLEPAQVKCQKCNKINNIDLILLNTDGASSLAYPFH